MIHSSPNFDLHTSEEVRMPVTSRYILLIDDDMDFQFILQKSLKKEGFECIGCTSVEQSLKQIKTATPSLVILDLGLRQASGFAFLENFANYVQKDKKVPPVVVMSGYCDQEIIEFAKSLGARKFIPKSVSFSQVVSVVRTFLSDK
jgi:DNA-binding NarL/FixJ family response regulator